MSIADEYLRRAEECERLAAECQSESNREILLYAAAKWRRMAEDATQGNDGLQDAGSVRSGSG